MLSKCPICDGELVPIHETIHDEKTLIGYFCDECGSYFDNKYKKQKVII